MNELEHRIEQLEVQIKETEEKEKSRRRNWLWFFIILFTCGFFDTDF